MDYFREILAQGRASDFDEYFYDTWQVNAGSLEDEDLQEKLLALDRLDIALSLVRNPALGYGPQKTVASWLLRALESGGDPAIAKTYALIIAFIIRNPNLAEELRIELARQTVDFPGLPALIMRAWQTEMGLTEPVLEVLQRSSVGEIKSFADGVELARVTAFTEFSRRVRHASLPPL
jgi:hypothetical protein